MAQTSQHLETLISSLGGKGKFQITIQLLVAFVYIPLVFNHIIMAFHGSSIPHKCITETDTSIGFNSTLVVNSTHSIIRYVTNITHEKCATIVDYSEGPADTIECNPGQWEYFPVYGEKNVVSEFDLVCDKSDLPSLATTIYFMGVMLGGLLFGDLADRFGRLPVVLATLYGAMVIGFITAFSNSWGMFALLRFMHGILIQGLQTSAYTLLMELFQARDRPYCGIVTELFFSSGIMILAGLAYGLRDWRHLQIVISLIPLVTLFFPWVIPESLRWLIMKGKIEKAEKQLIRICKTNKIAFPSGCWAQVKRSTAENMRVIKQYNFTDLFRSRVMMKRSLICFYIWLSVSLNYYGMTFMMTSLKGSRYLNFFISGLVETISFALTLPILNKFGRKKPMFTTFFFAGIMCLTCGLIRRFTSGLDLLVTVLAVLGKSSLSCTFAMFFIYSAELYPTVIRNIGMGSGMFFARLGSVLAPQVDRWAIKLFGISGVFIFGAVSFGAASLVLPLPETHRRQLPDSIEEEGGEEQRKGAEMAEMEERAPMNGGADRL